MAPNDCRYVGGLDFLSVTPRERLSLARQQLARVQVAWVEPTDWSDLAMYAFYALENAVVAAAEHLSIGWQRSHPKKADLAAQLHTVHHSRTSRTSCGISTSYGRARRTER